jgi:nicotinate-nucleotide adenylyltransferase
MPAQKKNIKVTGLFFGSFNPIHTGHLIIAGHILEWSPLDEIWFVVSPQNPLKNKTSLLAGHHRFALVNIAIDDNPKFCASNIEFSLPEPSYTINTLAALSEKYPNRTFVLIMGADSLQTLHKWKNYEVILKEYHIIVYPRPGSDGGAFRDHPRITWVEAPLMEISSTAIRNAILSGKSARYLLPDKVHDYIHEMHFYEK